MDDLEFRRKAILEPANQGQEFLQKARENRENRQFVEDQLDFQYALSKTLQIDVPENLSDRIILSRQLDEHKNARHHQHLYRLAAGIAATLVLSFSILLFLPAKNNSQQLSDHIIYHLYEDTRALDVKMDVPKSHIDTMLASYGGKLSAPIGNATFLGHCIVGKHTAIHLVLNTARGAVSVIILPSDAVKAEQQIADNHFQGIIYPSHKGSIAIISESPGPVAKIREKIDHSLNWLI